jgi:hypothetical protein
MPGLLCVLETTDLLSFSHQSSAKACRSSAFCLFVALVRGSLSGTFRKSYLKPRYPASKVEGNSANLGIRGELGRQYTSMSKTLKKSGWCSIVLGIALATIVLPTRASAQDEPDDPPGRVARLGYMQGSSFVPACRRNGLGRSRSQPSHEHGRPALDRSGFARRSATGIGCDSIGGQ